MIFSLLTVTLYKRYNDSKKITELLLCLCIYKINPCIDAANYQEFKNNFNTFKQAKGLIVDMRGYPRSCIYSILSNLIDSTLHVGKIETPICYFPYQRNRELILGNDSDNWVIYPGTKPQNGRWLSALSNEETQQLVKER